MPVTRSLRLTLSDHREVVISAPVRADVDRALRKAASHGISAAEGSALVDQIFADPAVTEDAERLVAQRAADTRLPPARPQRRHLARKVPHRRQNQWSGYRATS